MVSNNSDKNNGSYESQMFSLPYINQIKPRLPPIPPTKSTKLAEKRFSEYHDEISKTGALIMRLNLHDHSNCEKKKDGKCSHKISNSTKLRK